MRTLQHTYTKETPAFTTVVDISETIPINHRVTDLVFEIKNTSANAMTAFNLQARTTEDGTWFTILTGTDWDTVAGILKHIKGTVKTLAGGATGMGHIETGPWNSIKFSATAGAAATTTVTVVTRERV